MTPSTSDAPPGAAAVPVDSAPPSVGEIGTVVEVQGGACEIGGDGTPNMLSEGDRISLYKSMQTMSDGHLVVQFDSGSQLSMGAGRYAFVDDELAENIDIAALAGESSCQPDEVQRFEDLAGQSYDDGNPLVPPPGLENLEPGTIGQALALGADPSQLLEVSAAGLGPPAAGTPGVVALDSGLSEGSSTLPQLERTEQSSPGLSVNTIGPELGTVYESPLFGGEGDGLLAGDLIDLGGEVDRIRALGDRVDTVEGQAVTLDPMANDTLSEGATLASVGEPANGTVTTQSDGTVSYTPDEDFVGTDSFAYSVALADGSTVSATITVDVTPHLHAADDTASTTEDVPISIDVLANDTFETGARVSAVTQPATGAATIDADGLINFTPAEDFSGTETFTYIVTTRDGGTQAASVTVVVKPIADAADDAVTTTGDTAVNVNVLANDSFGPNATVVGVSGASNGVVLAGADGSIVYTPNPGFAGTETFMYTVRTAAGDQETATVSVAVVAANDPPIAVNDPAQSMDEDMTLSNVDVLSNDSDVDGDALTVTAASSPNGIVTVNADGTLNYAPNADFNGVDTVTYTISDGNGGTDTA
ncbi:MAG: Ig-like domain-containing protein, partial [Gammaproteobacteria bacterium]